MPYMREVCRTGRVIEIRKTICRSHQKSIRRNPKSYPAEERVKRSNDRIAERTLRRKLNTNFGHGDIFMTLTYNGEAPTKEEAKKELDNFLRRLRREYRRAGKEMKYIVVTEYEAKRIHHHVVLNYLDAGLVKETWQRGKTNTTFLDESGQYEALAAYLIKETKRTFKEEETIGKRYRCSRNLKAYDECKREVVSAKEWRKEPKAFQGYELDKASVMESMFLMGNLLFETQEYTMTKIETWEERRERKRKIRERGRRFDAGRTEEIPRLQAGS